MEIKSFQIKNYKGIVDTTIELNGGKGSVYALVGLNESGKTTILEAINNFRPDVEGMHALAQASAPKQGSSLVPKKHEANFNGNVEIIAKVLLQNDDKISIIEYFETRNDDPFKVQIDSLPDEFTITKRYTYKNSELQSSKTTNFWNISPKTKRKSERKYIRVHADNQDWQDIASFISEGLPRIVYFPTFLFDFPDKVLISDDNPPENVEANAYFRSMIEEALTSIEGDYDLQTHIVDRVLNHEKGSSFALWFPVYQQSNSNRQVRATLKELSNSITKEVFGRWEAVLGTKIHGKKLKLEPIIEAGPDGSRMVYLTFEIEDSDHIYKVSERSLGFRWFFSFLLFTKYFTGNKHRESIFLFDEPAANLHSMAQNKLLASLADIAGDRNIIIYTTHSHHLINPLWLENTYIVSNGIPNDDDIVNVEYEDANADIRAEKYKRFVGNHPQRHHYFQPILDKLQIRPLPIEARQGGVITEGKSDFYILNWYKKYHATDLKINFLPVEGAGNASALISLNLGLAQDFVVLLDSDGAGNRAKEKYLTKLPIRETQVVQIGDIFSGKKQIEDLISNDVKSQIRSSFSSSTKKSKDLILIAFSQDLYGKMKITADEETLENLKKLIDSLAERLAPTKN